jgi:isohexenylglutaconyl-CoA hydratase
MGRSQAARLVLEAEVLDAPAALAMGLVHEVLPDRAALDQRLARLLAALREAAPGALAETKALLAALGPVAPEGYAEAGVAAFARTAAGPEAAEGIAAFREKRKPAWAV